MLTETRWSSYVVASLTMSLDSDSASSGGWSGVLEVRSTGENTREFEKWPKDTVRLFGGDHVQLCSTAAASTDVRQPAKPLGSAVDASISLPAAPNPFDTDLSAPIPAPMQTTVTTNGTSAFATQEPAVVTATPNFAPDVRSTTSFHKDVSIPTDRLSSFARTQQQPEQTRAPEATADEQWGTFL
jgi:hypothetical protein